MPTAEEKAKRIYDSFVRMFDPQHGILIKTHIHRKAIQASKLHCIHTIDELQLVLDKLGYKENQGNCYYTDYPLKRLKLHQDALKHLESMTK